MNFMGYRRPDGSVGTRNYVVVLPTINCVTLTGALLKGSSAGNVVVPGVYTPGAYMEMLHRLLMAGNDVVTSVTIYK